MNRNAKNEASQDSLSIDGASADDEDESDETSDEEKNKGKNLELQGQRTKVYSDQSRRVGSAEDGERSSVSTGEFEAAYERHMKSSAARGGSASDGSRSVDPAPRLRPGKTVLFAANEDSDSSRSASSCSESSTTRQMVDD